MLVFVVDVIVVLMVLLLVLVVSAIQEGKVNSEMFVL